MRREIIESAPRARDPGLDVFQLEGELFGEQAPLAVPQDEHLILDADAEAALGQVDAGLDRDHCAGGQRRFVEAGVVDVESDEMAEAVDELVEVAGLAQRGLGGLLQIALPTMLP